MNELWFQILICFLAGAEAGLGSAPPLVPLALCVVFTHFWAQLAARIAARADSLLLNRLTGAILTAVGLLLLVLNLL